MRTATAFLSLLATVSAAGIPFFGNGATPGANAALKVPGESPLEYCSEDRSGDLLKIQSVDLSPNPPKAGTDLTIVASGIVYKDILDGAYVNLQVKYGLIRLINTQADLCEQVENVELECPIKKGVLKITKAVELPREIPPGKYTVLADVYSVDDEHITCLTATVVFSPDAAVDIEL